MAYTTPRTWVSSEVVTAAIMNTHVRDNLLALADRIQVVDKTADETVTSSTTLQNDDHLFFSVVAGQTYAFEINLIADCASASADLKVSLTFPTGTMSATFLALDPAVASGDIGSMVFADSPSLTSGVSTFVGATTSGGSGVRLSGRFVCTVSGTVRLQWAQNASSASGVTVRAGSSLVAIRKAA